MHYISIDGRKPMPKRHLLTRARPLPRAILEGAVPEHAAALGVWGNVARPDPVAVHGREDVALVARIKLVQERYQRLACFLQRCNDSMLTLSFPSHLHNLCCSKTACCMKVSAAAL